MSIIHRMTIRARHDRSIQLGQRLARLDEVGRDVPGCLGLRVFSLRSDPLTWHVEGQWQSSASRDAFLDSEGLRLILAQAIDEGLFAHLECAVEWQQQVA
ncbi:antibiotic biosynthesis monooxygenase [Ectopseudomonas mendocina]|uniref:antibiotic biosynthesis monooxygenase family protein n=1 Tax=Ectopseudomonas mendocina TaxID=300 RepID=UPI000E006925|nr:antibiotic biosynthesis monooxygenase family protein [Pseudomonas mendocina]MBL0949397.1 antibiotic biosynthesis monooxygenase [Pseudomonas sp.]SUD27841.1 antibiotic biosynthesis monooxygenase [Pseudomonas mendocina]